MSYPTSWTFDLDARTTHMSLVPAEESAGLVFATPDGVDEVLVGFARTAATPPDVASLLNLAHKLLRTSVIHYEFAALAAEKSLQALERAVRLRLGVEGRPNFKRLVEILGERMALSDEDKELLEAGRQLRNFFAHPETAPALPLVAVVGMLATSYRLVAVLFPDGGESQRDMVGG